MTESGRARVADLLQQAADEFRSATQHLDIAARHFRADEVLRGCAHTVAAEGHRHRAARAIAEMEEIHADHAVL